MLVSVFFVSCIPARQESRSAYAILQELLSVFPMGDGYCYGTASDAKETLTDEMVTRLFLDMRAEDLRYVEEMAIYLTKSFREGEIIVMKLFDPSHAKAVMSLLKRRAEKKENAALLQNGVYLYLICTDRNDAIISHLKG